MATKTRQRPTPQPEGRSIPIAGIAFGVIGLILVLAIVLTGGDSDGETRFGEVAVDGAALPIFPTGGYPTFADDPAFGSTIPTITGEDLAGEPMTIGAEGGPRAIAFLAHWCNHCQAEVPRVTEWVEATGGVDGVEIVSVTTSMDPVRGNFPPDEWLEDEGWPADVMRDDENGAAHFAYGAGGFPYWVFVNGNGEVVARTAGQLEIETLQALMVLARDA